MMAIRPGHRFAASSLRAALSMPRIPSLPSWQAYSMTGCDSSCVRNMPKLHAFVHVRGSSNVMDQSIPPATSLNRSTVLSESDAPL